MNSYLHILSYNTPRNLWNVEQNLFSVPQKTYNVEQILLNVVDKIYNVQQKTNI
jgi:hypothetical protein